MLTRQGVNMLCYEVRVKLKRQQQIKKKFGGHYGHRFDDENHNWIYLLDFLSLSHSYMSFVILSKMEDVETF